MAGRSCRARGPEANPGASLGAELLQPAAPRLDLGGFKELKPAKLLLMCTYKYMYDVYIYMYDIHI